VTAARARRIAVASVFAVVTAMLVTLPALALERARLALVAESGGDLARRLRAEAADLGLEVTFETNVSSNVPPSVIAERHAAVGVIRISSPSAVDLWIPSGEQRPATYETVRAQPGEGESFAFRVVEEVRARLIKLRLPDVNAAERVAQGPDASDDAARVATPRAASEGDAGARAGTRQRPGSLDIGAGVGGSAAIGGMGMALDAVVALRAPVASGFYAAAQALLPLTVESFSASEGTAKARAFVLMADVERNVWEHASWSAAIGAGAGGVILALDASPAAGYVGKQDRLTAAVFFLQARAGSEVTRWLSVHGALLGGVSTPRMTVHFDGREAAAWGRPFAAAILALDLTL
jgi:hypothetical protein